MKLPVIDFHTHIFPDHGASRIIKALEEEGNTKAFIDGTKNGLRQSMTKAKIDVSVQVPIATRGEQVESINDFVLKINSPQIISFGAIHHAYQLYKKEIQRLKDAGIKGIKFHPEYQDFYPDEEGLYPIYEEIVLQDMIAFFHAGRDIAFSGVHGTPARFARLIKNFPKLKIVLAHMGGFQMWDEVKEELLGQNVYFDTSFAMDYMTKNSFLELIEHHEKERILFGTDSPWQDQSQELEKLKKIIKNENTIEKIISKNAIYLLEL